MLNHSQARFWTIETSAALAERAGRDRTVAQLWRMREAFERAGGLCTSDQFAGRLRGLHSQPISCVARWIVNRQIVSFTWAGEIMVPCFQFIGGSLAPARIVARLLAELDPAMSDWEIGVWFATGNDALDARSPALALRGGDDDAVLRAACIARRLVAN